jgi:endonuclease YncB( thermonuclease family)
MQVGLTVRNLAILLSVTLAGAVQAEQRGAIVTGIPRIVDGDTIVLAGIKVRLEAIDAPETDQVCLDEKGIKWTCGVEARDRLTRRVGGREIACELSSTDRYGRSLGTCGLDGQNLNEWMVRQGWALAYIRYSRAYATAEADARDGLRGLWRGAFIAPWDWRHRDVRTVVLGALSVPITAHAQLLAPASSAEAPSPNCVIKGNINRSGERIFHLPGQLSYSRIRMDSASGKRWFCTAEEAEAAGWRPALR